MKVAEVSSFLDNLGESFNDEVYELGFWVSHVILFNYDILRQVDMNFHILNEELYLR